MKNAEEKCQLNATRRKICVSKFCWSEVSSSRPSSISVQSNTYSWGPKSSTTVLLNTNTEIVQSSLESIDWLSDVGDAALAAVIDYHTIFAKCNLMLLNVVYIKSCRADRISSVLDHMLRLANHIIAAACLYRFLWNIP